mmetsp:Transcript_6176/g.8273  ORF Transcript_6176/g.8273 Transcript_6176/m.8273 type:complete len:82 (+) Transcript_6176:642-887(+)
MNGLPRMRLVSSYDLTQTAPVTTKIELIERILGCVEYKLWTHLKARSAGKDQEGQEYGDIEGEAESSVVIDEATIAKLALI